MNENIGSKYAFFGHEVHFLHCGCSFFLVGDFVFYVVKFIFIAKKRLPSRVQTSGETGFAHGGVCIAN
jgi:hypothetical protein